MRLSWALPGTVEYGAAACVPTSLTPRSPMSSMRKALLSVVAVVVLAVAFALAQPSDEAETPTTSDEPVRTTEEPATVEDVPAPDEQDGEAPTATAPAAPPVPAATRIRVRGGAPVGGVQTIEVEAGDRIRFTVSSDQSDEVHVHGYDLEKPVAPDAPARFSFTADADGIFEVELHGSGAQIAELRVNP